jgi:hypothetical protein
MRSLEIHIPRSATTPSAFLYRPGRNRIESRLAGTTPPRLNDLPQRMGMTMTLTYVLIVLFTVDYGSLGNPDNGRSGPASVSVPGYANLAACNAAKKALRDQVQDPNLKKRTLAFCIPGPGPA